MWGSNYVLVLFLSNHLVSSARILGIFPQPSISHQIVFRRLTFELARRGHELVIVTPNPVETEDGLPPNITQLNINNSYYLLKNYEEDNSENLLRGAKLPAIKKSYKDSFITSLLEGFLKHPNVSDLIQKKKGKFDLVITEPFYLVPLAFAWLYESPVIMITSSYGSKQDYSDFGAPAFHPFLYPNYFRDRFQNLTLWEKICELYVEVRLSVVGGYDTDSKLDLKKYFGYNVPDVRDLVKNVDLYFVNANPIFEWYRPMPPNVIHLGNMHLEEPKELPMKLMNFLDKSKSGVVYFSLGTTVKTKFIQGDLLNVFVQALGALPYDVIWKFDDEYLENLPPNIMIEKWFPQRDLLLNPNIKAFVTQGGLQSTDEGIAAAVPLVGIPLVAEQSFNCEHYVRLGIGVKLEVLTLTADELTKNIRKVIEDPGYKSRAMEVRDLMFDQMETSLERATWWTEYVLRHGRVKQLQPPSATCSWFDYLMLDVVCTIFTGMMLFLICVIFLFKFILDMILKLKAQKWHKID